RPSTARDAWSPPSRRSAAARSRPRACRSASTSDKRVAAPTALEIGLTAAIVAVDADEPMTLTAGDGVALTGLPSAPFDPLAHHTSEIGLRSWVRAQTGLAVGYVEQLYTFGDRGRHAEQGDRGPHVVSVGYLALTRMPDSAAVLRASRAGFTPWYRFFP